MVDAVLAKPTARLRHAEYAGIAASLTRLRSLATFKNETLFNATCEQLFDAPNDLNPAKFPEVRW